ncbi:MAG: hypothetical protein LBL18_02365 [Bacteroidales bacterium]|jgi:hypothetical protein|nr:hypothetical protein [Bacteroidales bacterium]
MYKFGKNLIIGLLIVSTLIATSVSCTKENGTPKEEQKTEDVIQEKGFWVAFAIVVAAVVVIIKCTEGQYSETKTVNADGSYTVTKKCSGMGHCAINAHATTKEGKITPVSSVEYFDPIDLEGQGMLAQDNKGRIIYAMENTPENLKSFDRFFYDDKISISRPWTIDNINILKQLNTSVQKIVVQGSYDVHTEKEGDRILKYIIIK